MKKPNEKELEQFIHANRCARRPTAERPATLSEARVLAEIERRAAVAWYHRSWAFWPAPIRALFLAVASGFSGAAVLAFFLVSHGFDVGTVAQEIGSHFTWLTGSVGVAEWIVDFTGRMLGSIPPLWLYSGLAFIAALYLAFSAWVPLPIACSTAASENFANENPIPPEPVCQLVAGLCALRPETACRRGRKLPRRLRRPRKMPRPNRLRPRRRRKQRRTIRGNPTAKTSRHSHP